MKKAFMVQDQYGDKMIKITFSYDIETLNQVRSLFGRKYYSEEKFWIAPLYKETLNSLQSWGFELDSKLLKSLNTSFSDILPISNIPGLKGIPFPYQYDGVAFIEYKDGRVLVADEMGLGKTIQALAWVQLHRDRVPVLIVCPASLKLNWKREIESWLPDPDVEILSGETTWKPLADILIINYDVLPAWIAVLQSLNIQILITDECHYYKNNAARRTKAIKRIAKTIPHVIALSGTPIVNKPVEAYNAINIIKPDLFSNFMDFTRTYCGAKHNGYGWDFNGATNTDKLHSILTESIMIRRLKKNVLKDLPDKIYSFIPFELDNEREYNQARSNIIAWIKDNKGDAQALRAKNAEALVKIEALKQLAVQGVLTDTIEWIRDFLETGNKLVVFATHKIVIEALTNSFKTDMYVKIDGSVTLDDRQRSVDAFQFNPNVKLFIGNIKAAGVGITLTAASNVVFLELPWTPGELKQAIDRVHRIGQKDCVNVYYLFAVNTIMDRMAKGIDAKQKILDAVIDGIHTDESTLLYELMKEFE
jgi:SNF2 family DNA or RNA helicase